MSVFPLPASIKDYGAAIRCATPRDARNERARICPLDARQRRAVHRDRNAPVADRPPIVTLARGALTWRRRGFQP